MSVSNLKFFFLLQQIRVIVKNIEKSSRDILMTLQNIHTINSMMEENISMFLEICYIMCLFNIYYI